MRIKVAFVDSDTSYLEKLKNKVRKDYSSEIEAGYYGSLSDFIADYKNNRANVAVINSSLLGDDFAALPCPAVLLSEDNANGTMGDYPVVGKYQKFDEVYRKILGAYSDSESGAYGFVPSSVSGKKIIVFASPAGGTGSSTMAVACAEHLGRVGKRVLYINLEKIAFYYYTHSAGGFDDLLFTLKENKANLHLKIESLARKTSGNVVVLPDVSSPLDLQSFDHEDRENLLDALVRLDSIDYIVIDTDFELNDSTYALFDKATSIVMTTDGSQIANHKVKKSMESLEVMQGKYSYMEKIALLYNKSSLGSDYHQMPEYKSIGTVSRYKATVNDIVKEVSSAGIFDCMI